MGNNSDCNNCLIEYKNTKVSGVKLQQPIVYEVNITNLFEEFKFGKCPLMWERVGGYRYVE